jgi:TRAP-type C4-dicarboxylate transport system substrate-binding protein
VSARLACVALTLLLPSTSSAKPGRVQRIATVAPEGTAWARELAAGGRELDVATNGEMRVKWYWGGIAGDEDVVEELIRRERLDGIASGGMMCQRVAPSMKVLMLPGVFQTEEEVEEVLSVLRPTLEKEARDSGFTLLSTTVLGPTVLFSRDPVRTMADFRRVLWWRWRLEDLAILMSREMGLQLVPTALHEASAAYESNRVNGFMAIPGAALAFQWSTQVRYFTDLRVGFVAGCLLIANRAFDRRPLAEQAAARSIAAKVNVRMQQIDNEADAQLLGGLFVKQGLKQVPASDAFRADFFEAARAARERLGEKLIPSALLDQTLRILADYRAEHGLGRRLVPRLKP